MDSLRIIGYLVIGTTKGFDTLGLPQNFKNLY
jgi:hypothetical protein